MECLRPVTVYFCGETVAKDGVISPRMFFSATEAEKYFGRIGQNWYQVQRMLRDSARHLSCGKCILCKKRKRQDMSVRLAHETTMHEKACFITLTYNDDNIPYADWFNRSKPDVSIGKSDGFKCTPTLLPSDVQKFVKRLRRHLEYVPKRPSKFVRDHVTNPIRYFCVGEYGTKSGRPHYHLIVYGWHPTDRMFHQFRKTGKDGKGYVIYRSAQIEKLWDKGFSTVCEVNVGVSKYCAQYVTKKFTSADAEIDDFRCPQFFLQSVKNGGIGAPWLEKYQKFLVNGFVNVDNGHVISKCSVPKYYYDRLRKINLPFWLDLRDQRIEFIRFRPLPQDEDIVKRKEELLGKADTYLYLLRCQVEREIL